MDELVSRQVALVAVKNALMAWSYMPEWRDKKIIEAIAELSPIQPDIVRCKDCKHHWTHKCMDSMPIERCDLEQTFYDAEIDFCSLAEGRE